jgi:hypothetical protein
MMHYLVFTKRLEENKVDSFYFGNDKSDAYNKIKVGDTLIKKENSDSLFKLKNGVPLFIDRFDCGCDTNTYIKKNGHFQKKEEKQ